MHRLTIEERILYKINSLAYDVLHTSQPQYLKNLINIKLTGSIGTSDHLTLHRPSVSLLKISNRSFNQTAPIFLNN